jgi:ribosomal protein S18 acetylase RimI-like enzyme
MSTLSTTRQAVSVREWTPRDDAFVAQLSEEAFGEYGARASSYTLAVTHRASTRTWVAVQAGLPVGMVVLELGADEGAVLAVAVVARARARGIGGRLMQVAESYAAARGALRLSLFTADANVAALDLFLRRGFRIVGRRRWFYARRQDACKLEKALPKPRT